MFVDIKFITFAALKLRNFKQKKQYLWNFSCPMCGDSQKNKHKARGYLYRTKTNINYICHNCGSSMSLGNFIKSLDPHLYSQYQLEKYKNESHSNVARPDFSMVQEKPVFFKSKINLPKLSDLEVTHPARVYAESRKIPRLNELYFAEDFRAFALSMFPETSSGIKKLHANDQRIVIPFYDEQNILQGVQGRTISNSKIRYITLKMAEDSKKVFGLNKVDFSKTIYVTEGIFDSLFLSNSIALMDASLYKVRNVVGNHDYVLIPDRDIRNKEVVKSVEKMIKTGYKVCLLPFNFPGKDLNEAIMTGMSVEELKNIIDKHSYVDLRAILEFGLWKKV